MQNRDSVAIVERFFLALETLQRDKIIRGKKTFTSKYGINRWNLLTLQKEPSRDIFQVGWLTYLVTDFGVNPLWLLTGTGTFYQEEKPQKNRKGEKRMPNTDNATI